MKVPKVYAPLAFLVFDLTFVHTQEFLDLTARQKRDFRYVP